MTASVPMYVCIKLFVCVYSVCMGSVGAFSNLFVTMNVWTCMLGFLWVFILRTYCCFLLQETETAIPSYVSRISGRKNGRKVNPKPCMIQATTINHAKNNPKAKLQLR